MCNRSLWQVSVTDLQTRSLHKVYTTSLGKIAVGDLYTRSLHKRSTKHLSSRSVQEEISIQSIQDLCTGAVQEISTQDLCERPLSEIFAKHQYKVWQDLSTKSL